MSRTNEEWETAINLKIREVLTNTRVIVNHTVEDFASIIDHTLLRPDATPAEINVLCDEAIKYKFKVGFSI